MFGFVSSGNEAKAIICGACKVAKQQSFADKSKGKAKSDTVSVKCIFSVQDETSGSWKFRQKLVKVKEPKDVLSIKL
jgi:hypothetical protein